MRLLLGTTNPGKIREVRHIMTGAPVTLVTLDEIGPVPAPEETGRTFWENARHKALGYARATGLPAIAEDSGLEIDALGGEPGVHSARYLGPSAAYPDRFADIFRRLDQVPSAARDARFVTALAVADGDGILFETDARIEGMIAAAASGTEGFGYDPIFLYPPFGRTTGALTLDEKAAVSHRARAFRDLRRWLAEAGGGPRPDH